MPKGKSKPRRQVLAHYLVRLYTVDEVRAWRRWQRRGWAAGRDCRQALMALVRADLVRPGRGEDT